MAVGGFRRQAPLDTADDRACSDSVASEDLPRSRTMILRVGARCCSEVRCAWLSADGHRAATPCSPCKATATQDRGRAGARERRLSGVRRSLLRRLHRATCGLLVVGAYRYMER